MGSAHLSGCAGIEELATVLRVAVWEKAGAEGRRHLRQRHGGHAAVLQGLVPVLALLVGIQAPTVPCAPYI